MVSIVHHTPQAQVSLASVHCLQEIYFECRSKKLRALKLQQYDMAEEERASLPACLTHNQFNKAAWKSWHASMYGDKQRPLAKVQLALLLHPACIRQNLCQFCSRLGAVWKSADFPVKVYVLFLLAVRLAVGLYEPAPLYHTA